MPKRIQRKRTKGWRMPPNTVYIGRPTKWGNPIRLGLNPNWVDYIVVSQIYRQKLVNGELPFTIEEIRAELAGKDLACWCPLNQSCHGDILLELANKDD